MKKALLIILSVMLVLAFIMPASAFSSIDVKGIKLDKSKITLNVGETYKLKATLTPANTTHKTLAYATGNKNIATIDATGLIKGVGSGTTTITVYTYNKLSAKCNVTVTQLPLYNIKVLTNMAIDPTVKTSNENEIGKVIKQKFNIVFEYIPYTGDYVEKANLLLATGDYPEMMTLSGPDLIRKYIEAGAAINLEKYFNVCPNFLKDFKEQIPFWRSFSADKKVHHWEGSVGGGEPEKIMPTDVAIRSDALQKQNWPNVIKEDALIAFLKQAVKDFPEVDGKKTIGITAPFAEPWGLQGIAPVAYEKGEKYVATAGNNDVIWNVKDNKYEDYFLNQYVYESLRFFNKLYRDGLLDPECFTDKYQQTVDKMKSGRALATWYAVWPMADANAGFVAAGHPEMKYVSAPFQTNTQYNNGEKRVRALSSTNNFEACVLTKKAKDPARIMKFLNWTLSDEGQILLQSGVEGKCYVIKNGKRELTNQFLKDFNSTASDWKKKIGLALEYRFLPKLNGNANDGLPYSLSTPEVQAKIMDPRQNEYNVKGRLNQFLKNVTFKPVDFVASITLDPKSDLGRVEPKLIDFRNKASAQLILAKTEDEFQSIWNNAVAEYKKFQPEKVVAEYNRLYKEQMSTISK